MDNDKQLAEAINNAMMQIDENMSTSDFALAVAKVLNDEYNQANKSYFLDVLKVNLK